MIEALEYYQSLAEHFESQLLTLPGILIVLVGLSLWLAGLRWRKIIGSMAGAVIGMSLILAAGYDGAIFIVSAGGLGLIIGGTIEKIVLGVFGAGVTFLIIVFLMAVNAEVEKPKVEFYDGGRQDSKTLTADDFMTGSSYPMWPEYEDESIEIDTSGAMKITVGMAKHFIDKGRTAICSCQTGCWASAGFGAIIMAVMAMAVPRLYIAMMSSVMGSAVIYIGMIMLLFYKGSKPINIIASRGMFFAIAFLAMIVFGMIVQMVLSKPVAKVKKNKKETKDKGSQ